MAVTYYTTFTVQADMIVSCECENCGQTYSFKSRPVTYSLQVNKHSSEINQEMKLKYVGNAYKGLELEKQKAINSKIYGSKKCPNCGYTQSWMFMSPAYLLLCTILAIALIVLFFWLLFDGISRHEPLPTIGWYCLPLSGVGIFFLMARALSVNKKFGKVERKNIPSISFETST
jgi:hypothetical protein